MQTMTLYKYNRPDGGVTVSPTAPESGEYTVKYRLIADEGKALTNGVTVTTCTDVDGTDGWTEIDAPGEESPEVIAAVDEAIGILKGEEQG